ncbi:glycosyltransferase [Opitutales bacterium]|nr:glycosyltransferase [Opitutales bacterium]
MYIEQPNDVPDQIDVSICMVTYQHEHYIAQAIESVLSQKTKYRLELCIGEDGSTDGTRDICLKYAEQYPETIRLFLGDRKDNISILGRPSGRSNGNHLRCSARGKYAVTLEGDDFWTDPNKLQMQITFLECHPEYVGCFHQVAKVDEQGEFLEMFSSGLEADVKVDDVLLNTRHHTSSLLLRNTQWLSHPDDWLDEVLLFDRYLVIRATLEGKVAYFEDCMSSYRIHEGGIYSGSQAYYRAHTYIVMYRSFLKNLKGLTVEQRLRVRLSLRARSVQFVKMAISLRKFDGLCLGLKCWLYTYCYK